jgi:light-regulated signal transduction histidine kinase (bacteriophytochrome)
VPSWETQCIAKDGHLIDIWVTATAQLDEQGLPVAILTTARDITERKRTEDQLRELNLNLERLVIERTQALEEANRRLTQEIEAHRQAEAEIRRLNESLEGRVAQRTRELTRSNQNLEKFSYSIAHDLRAPLRAIHGFASILEESLAIQATGDQHHFLDRIKANSVRMGDLIDDILAFSRLSRAAMQIHRVDMEALARKTAAQMAGLCTQAQVRIAPLPPAYADPTLLQCVFENLLSNALKFSTKCEDPVVEVGVEQSAEGETVFFVSDNGAGFDMGATTHLFDPFIRLHDSAEYPGTGVGLAIVKNVIERHHGRVWAQAAPGQGAKFSFTLGKQHGEPEVQKAPSPAEP